MAGKKDYFGMGYLASVILALIPITSWILGFATRFKEKKILAGVLRLILGWNIIYVLDFFCILFTKKIFRIL